MKTNLLTKETLKALTVAGFTVWRQNNGGVYDPTLKRFRANSSTPGISDVIGFHRKTGQFVAAEIKAGKDKLSPYQERFLSEVEKSGGLALVIKTADDIEKIYKTYNHGN